MLQQLIKQQQQLVINYACLVPIVGVVISKYKDITTEAMVPTTKAPYVSENTTVTNPKHTASIIAFRTLPLLNFHMIIITLNDTANPIIKYANIKNTP